MRSDCAAFTRRGHPRRGEVLAKTEQNRGQTEGGLDCRSRQRRFYCLVGEKVGTEDRP